MPSDSGLMRYHLNYEFIALPHVIGSEGQAAHYFGMHHTDAHHNGAKDNKQKDHNG